MISSPTRFRDLGYVRACLLGKRVSFQDLVRKYEAPVWLCMVQDGFEYDRSHFPDVDPDAWCERSDPIRLYQSKHDVVDEVVVYEDRGQPPRKLLRYRQLARTSEAEYVDEPDGALHLGPNV